MTNRDHAPAGAPTWVDLWTSDVDGSRAFYSELFGWVAEEPSAEFGGYFMFTRNGVPVAGGMGDMPDMPADNSWKVYLATDDIERTVKAAEANGATLFGPAMPVADLGIQAVLADSTGATVGAWQAGTFPGLTVLEEPGAPSWFELHTSDHATTIAFYHDVFGWETEAVSDTDEFRYSMMQDPEGGMGARRGHGRLELPARGPVVVLVDLLGVRRRRRHHRAGHLARREGRGPCRGHPLRAPRRPHRPRRCPVQAPQVAELTPRTSGVTRP